MDYEFYLGFNEIAESSAFDYIQKGLFYMSSWCLEEASAFDCDTHRALNSLFYSAE